MHRDIQPGSILHTLLAERDAALERAERAEGQLVKLKDIFVADLRKSARASLNVGDQYYSEDVARALNYIADFWYVETVEDALTTTTEPTETGVKSC